MNAPPHLEMHGLQVNLVRNPEAPEAPSIIQQQWMGTDT